MVALSETALNKGIYTPAEAARLCRARTDAVTRWVFGDARTEPVVEAELAHQRRIITFADLVQAMAIRYLRTYYEVPLPTIREAIKIARRDYQVDRPLAYKHEISIFDREIFIKVPTLDGQLTGVSGADRHQHPIRQIVEPLMRHVSFDDNWLASMVTLHPHADYPVVIDPTRRMGQPIIQGLNILADVLAMSVKAEGSYQAAADVHDVDIDAVYSAFDFYQSYSGTAK